MSKKLSPRPTSEWTAPSTGSSLRFEIDALEKELSVVRAAQMRLGKAMGWSLEVLQKDEAEEKDRALDCLAHVKEVLESGDLGRIDERRLSQHPPAEVVSPLPVQAQGIPPVGVSTLQPTPSSRPSPFGHRSTSSVSRASPFSRHEGTDSTSGPPRLFQDRPPSALTFPSRVSPSGQSHSRSPSMPVNAPRSALSPTTPSQPSAGTGERGSVAYDPLGALR